MDGWARGVVPSQTVGAVLRDAATSAEYPLDEGDAWTIGRGPTCDIALIHDTVSRLHLSLQFASGGWHAEDLGSENGTLLNGVRINGREELRSGDLLRLGRVLLAFRSDGKVPRIRPRRVGSGIHQLPLPQSFEGLLTL